ncbi:MAG: peptidoglycan DD-metalloendopeptidase family protein [Lachnospiraceae bacterium]|nr:peptidoglycan DD-metalloendopeptidase family protein [Lachnospiraceae bacterium]
MKKRRHLKKYIIVFLILGLFLLPEEEAGAVSFSSITSESIREKEGQISNAQNEKEQLQSALTDIKALKEQLEGEKASLENYVVALDNDLAEIQKKISELNGRIVEKEQEIQETEEELEAAICKQEEQYEAMKLRIQMMYEQNDNYYLEMILKAESFGDLLNKLDYIQLVAEYDDQKLQEYKLIREYVEICKAELDAEKEVLDAAKTGVEQEEASMEQLISDKQAEIVAKQSDIGNKAAAIEEYEADIKAQNELIASLEAAVAAERKRIAEENRSKLTYDGGMFCFPAPSYTRISDDYGNRIHPTLGVEQFHNGIDLASPNGSPILAAYDGEVVAAAYSGSMGNYVMIDHGDSLYTIYMHASALYVSKGDIVAKGEQIAAVGSTGRSTGPHLHFSVRKSGSYVSPWGYLG